MSELPPEVPAFAAAHIVEHPHTGADVLLATTEDGRRLAFGFEVEGSEPGVALVDPQLWLAAGGDETSAEAFAAVQEPFADDWLPAIVAHPVGNEWVKRVEEAHPDAYRTWHALRHYDEGGEEGSG